MLMVAVVSVDADPFMAFSDLWPIGLFISR